MRTNRIVSILALLALSSSLVFASSAKSLWTDFESALDSDDVEAAIESYDRLQEKIDDEMDDLMGDIQKAYQKNDGRLYRNAVADMRTLESYSISSEDTDAMLRAIVNSDSENATEWAAWLYDNSRYYHPTLTLSTDVSSTGYRQSYRRSLSVEPGSDVTLPSSMDVNPSAAGVLVGWGITPDEVTYEAGATIQMPYTDQTLYAIYQSQVVFSDNGNDSVFTDVEDGDVIEIPSPAVSDGAIFEGWYDRLSGQYLAPDETEYTVKGMGASFEALYTSLEATGLETGHYDVDRIPTGVQIPLTVTVENTGSEDLASIDIEVASDSEYVTLMNTSAHARRLDAGSRLRVRGTQLVVSSSCPTGTQIPISVTMTDSEGNAFTSTFNLTTR